jgi:L-ascorbate 6-phosphate lactonase
MHSVLDHPLTPEQAALWWLGQAGYIVRCGELTVVIDPYLSDSAAGPEKLFTRRFPAPVAPEELRADILLITHDHGDHLDPETLSRYRHTATTTFVAPRHAARRLRELGISAERIVILNVGDTCQHGSLTLRGTFCLPTGPEVIDTTGYHLAFSNGRSVWFVSDTAWHPLLLDAAPRTPAPEVVALPINGKWGNLSAEQAVELTAAVGPHHVFPNHFDLMALNAENPDTFRWFLAKRAPHIACVVPERLVPFVWN